MKDCLISMVGFVKNCPLLRDALLANFVLVLFLYSILALVLIFLLVWSLFVDGGN